MILYITKGIRDEKKIRTSLTEHRSASQIVSGVWFGSLYIRHATAFFFWVQ
jgi:hypothetical protein